MINTAIRLREIYAQTLFELAAEQKSVDTVKNDLDILSGIIEQEKNFIKLLGSPYFSTDYKEQWARKLLSEVVTSLTMTFLSTVIKHGRARLLTDIIARYDELWDAYNGYSQVKVTVPKHLDDSEVKRLSDDITAAINSKVKLEMAVKPDLIGGAVIRCGGKVIDNSVKNRLDHAVKTVIGKVRNRE
jgi:F-type H+-transporting ATPase subunit delta